MTSHILYYLVQEGEISKDAQQFRKNWIAQRKKIITYLKKHFPHCTGYCIGWNGVIWSLKFEQGKVPEGFCKLDRNGGTRPKKKSETWGVFDKIPTIEENSDPLLIKKYNIPLFIEYKTKDKSQGLTRIGNWSFTTSLEWFDNKGPILLKLPNVKQAIEMFKVDHPGATIVNKEILKWKPPEGLKPIMKEEWELIQAKHEMKEKKKNV